ncbi:MAG: aminotransferase class IV family protein [Thermoleophilia bacterium]|nr:aminotransferase class IV family protein [Thermoleophilia bacterium]
MEELPLLTSIDGLVTPSDEAHLPLPDDGAFRGDGVFEVLRAYGPKLFALEDHLDRLERSAAAIDLTVDRASLEAESLSLLERAEGTDCLLRIVSTRMGRRIITLENLLAHPPSISLATVTCSPTVILNGVKSLSYAANMQATRIARKAGALEALLVAPDGTVLEAPTSTLFWVSPGGNLRTTELEAGVLDSITRDRIIHRVEVEVGSFPIEDVMGSSEAFLASTTREIQPVDSIDGQPIPVDPGPRTVECAAAFTAALNA